MSPQGTATTYDRSLSIMGGTTQSADEIADEIDASSPVLRSRASP